MNIRSEAIETMLFPEAKDFFCVTVVDALPSTNTALKAMAGEGAPAGTVLIARSQTAGRGRLGRSFYSPGGSGLYMSVLLRPTLPAELALRLTTTAAVAAAEAIDAVNPSSCAKIKWVNDIYIRDRKAAGILTEAAVSPTGGLAFAVLGIGVNLLPPLGGFPPLGGLPPLGDLPSIEGVPSIEGFPSELAGIAGAVFDGDSAEEDGGNRLAAAFLNRLAGMLDDPCAPAIAARYRSRSLLDGRRVTVRRQSSLGGEEVPALAVGVEENLGLRVRYDDDTEEVLTSGEIVSYSVHLI